MKQEYKDPFKSSYEPSPISNSAFVVFSLFNCYDKMYSTQKFDLNNYKFNDQTENNQKFLRVMYKYLVHSPCGSEKLPNDSFLVY